LHADDQEVVADDQEVVADDQEVVAGVLVAVDLPTQGGTAHVGSSKENDRNSE
jgi:hypothetical protein